MKTLLASLLSLSLTGCAAMVGVAMDGMCKISNNMSDEDAALIAQKQHRFPILLEYRRNGAVTRVEDTLVCKYEDTLYDFGCDQYMVQWNERWEKGTQTNRAGDIQLLDVDADHQLGMSPGLCESLVHGEDTHSASLSFYDTRLEFYDSAEVKPAELKDKYGIEILRYEVGPPKTP